MTFSFVSSAVNTDTRFTFSIHYAVILRIFFIGVVRTKFALPDTVLCMVR